MEDKSDLKLTQDFDEKVEALRQALIEDEESGFADYSIERIIKELDNLTSA